MCASTWVTPTCAEGIENEYRLLKPRIRSTHVHDNNGEDDSHLFPGQKEGPWIGPVPWTCCARRR